MAGDTNSLPIQVHTNKEYHFWINLYERSLIFYMLHHFIRLFEEYAFIFNRNSDWSIFEAHFAMLFQWACSGTPGGGRCFLDNTFLASCHLLGTLSPNYLGSLVLLTAVNFAGNPFLSSWVCKINQNIGFLSRFVWYFKDSRPKDLREA